MKHFILSLFIIGAFMLIVVLYECTSHSCFDTAWRPAGWEESVYGYSVVFALPILLSACILEGRQQASRKLKKTKKIFVKRLS